MANVASPYGLRPINLIGGQPYAGSTRELKLSTNNSAGMFAGDIIQLTAAGNPQALAATPTTSTAGVVGVMVGARYVNPSTKQSLWGQFVPAGAITAGYTEVYIQVVDDPDVLFRVQGSAAFGSLTNGGYGAVGKNAALGNFANGNTATGNSAVHLVVGTNGGSLASTATLAMRVVDVVRDTINDEYPDLIVKFNAGVHSYTTSTGV